MKKIAIIGAGLAGITVANLLKDYAEVKIFEKSKGPGGRMSTRRRDNYSFDHGAQYFTAREEPFQKFIQPLIEQGVIEIWNARYAKFDGTNIISASSMSSQEPRYVGVPGMNNILKFLAQGLKIDTGKKIVSLSRTSQDGKWQLTDEQKHQYSDFDWVICTAPSPQCLEIIPKSFKYFSDVQSCEMQSCFSLMLGFKNSFTLEFESAHVINSDISWIAVNSHKPKRSDYFSLVIHSSEDYARAHIDDDFENVKQHLIKETSRVIGFDVSIADHQDVHRWKYSSGSIKSKNSDVFLDAKNCLAVCGDWCVGGRVEGAFISAYNLVSEIKELII